MTLQNVLEVLTLVDRRLQVTIILRLLKARPVSDDLAVGNRAPPEQRYGTHSVIGAIAAIVPDR